ncbi:MAG TPA: AAA family ATPase [Candidatus Lokiarchaeia archaeon]|nr:AAA family ATPase [Candidatus Lokiarchaeia archaeon]
MESKESPDPQEFKNMSVDRVMITSLQGIAKSPAAVPPASTRNLKYNVIYPSGDEQEYLPMLSFDNGDSTLTEIDIILKAIEQDRSMKNKNVTTFYFMSPPGLGKTVLGAHLARLINCPYQIVNCVSTINDLDLLGSFVLIGQETVWQDGPLPSIIRATNENGTGILIINELNALSLNAQIALNPLMDKQQCVVLTLNNNEIVKVQSDAHLLIIASMNPDILGVNELQDSVRDRSNAVIYMDYPSVDKEADLVSKLVDIHPAIARQFADVISECRLLKTRDHKITKAPSTRGLLDWINYSRVWGVETAYKLTIVNRYGTTEDERNALFVIGKGKYIAGITVSPGLGEDGGVHFVTESIDDHSSTPAIMKSRVQRQAYEMHNEGIDVNTIAKALGRSRTSIYRYIRRESLRH